MFSDGVLKDYVGMYVTVWSKCYMNARKYLKSDPKIFKDLPVIKCNALTVQHDESSECGSLCLYVLKKLSLGVPFQDIIIFLDQRYQKLPTAGLKMRVSRRKLIS